MVAFPAEKLDNYYFLLQVMKHRSSTTSGCDSCSYLLSSERWDGCSVVPVRFVRRTIPAHASFRHGCCSAWADCRAGFQPRDHSAGALDAAMTESLTSSIAFYAVIVLVILEAEIPARPARWERLRRLGKLRLRVRSSRANRLTSPTQADVEAMQLERKRRSSRPAHLAHKALDRRSTDPWGIPRKLLKIISADEGT